MAAVATVGWLGMGLGSYQAGYFYDISANYRLSFANAAVAGVVNLLIVAARTAGAPGDKNGLTLFLVDPKANARRRRIVHRAKRGIDSVDFDPNRIRVERVLGRKAGAR